MTTGVTLSIEICCEDCKREPRPGFDLFLEVTIDEAAPMFLCVGCWLRPPEKVEAPTRVLEVSGASGGDRRSCSPG